MKRFIMIIAAVIATMFSTTSCDYNPQWVFDVEIVGEVSDAPTNIQAELNNRVHNTPVDAEPLMIMSKRKNFEIEAEPSADALEIVDDIANNITEALQPSTIYDFMIRGFVSEKTSGLTFAVNKRFTNKIE